MQNVLKKSKLSFYNILILGHYYALIVLYYVQKHPQQGYRNGSALQKALFCLILQNSLEDTIVGVSVLNNIC